VSALGAGSVYPLAAACELGLTAWMSPRTLAALRDLPPLPPETLVALERLRAGGLLVEPLPMLPALQRHPPYRRLRAKRRRPRSKLSAAGCSAPAHATSAAASHDNSSPLRGGRPGKNL